MLITLMTLFRLITAVLTPLCAVILTIITLRQVRQDSGTENTDSLTCYRCGQDRQGAEGEFTYAERIGSPRQLVKNKAPLMPDTSTLKSESHFICDRCANGYLHTEMLVQTLMAVGYPLYRFVIIPVFAHNEMPVNVLLEGLLVVLTIGGMASAYDLYRVVKTGDTPLAEARDQVAIRTRKPTLGKGFSYFTRIGTGYLKKSYRSSDPD